MRSDWHRYNLKRRVSSLPPLSSEVFAEKVFNAQATSSAAAAKASYEKACTACQRTYYSENAYLNHIGSSKHKQRVHALETSGQTDTETASIISSTISLGEPLDGAAVEDEDELETEGDVSKVAEDLEKSSINAEKPAPEHKLQSHRSGDGARPESAASTAPTTETAQSSQMPVFRCLFCNYDSPNLKLNVLHMTKFHGLFVPEQAYLDDQEGLIRYLQAKVVENYECIYCHKLKGSMHGVQTHMRDKGHCMIAFETEEELIEIGQFYDFRSTYSDGEDDEDDKDDILPQKGAKLGARRTSQQEEGAQNEDWETDSDESVATDEITSVPIDQDYHRLAQHRHHTHSDPRSHKAPDGFHSHAHQHYAAFYSDHELHLSSGRVAGHRSLSRYFRQNLHHYPTAQERLNNLLLDRPQGEAEGGDTRRGRDRQVVKRSDLGMVGVTDQKKKEIAAVTKRAQQRAEHSQRQYQWGVQRRANNQKHFRDDNFGTHI